MFLTNQISIEFDNLGFLVNVPNNEQITSIYLKSQEIFKKAEICPSDFSEMGALVAPCLAGVPDGWDNIPEITRSRLLFEIAKFLLNEALTVPEIKKK